MTAGGGKEPRKGQELPRLDSYISKAVVGCSPHQAVGFGGRAGRGDEKSKIIYFYWTCWVEGSSCLRKDL